MLEVETVADLSRLVGSELGKSPWFVIDQAMIDKFAEATGDYQWIHVDTERAKKELPGGKTIAHGYLTVSLLPKLHAEIFKIKQRGRSLNYGSNKVRFTAPVPAGSKVQLTLALSGSRAFDGGWQFVFSSLMAIEGQTRPVLVAETISQVYE